MFWPYNIGFNYFLGVAVAMMHFSYWNWRDIKFWIEFVNWFILFVKTATKTWRSLYLIGLIIMFSSKLSEYLIINYVNPYGSEYNVVAISSSYLICSKMFYCITILVFFIPILAGKAKYLRWLLQASVLWPFAWISYGCYLMHGLILMWYMFSWKQISPFTNQLFIYIYTSVLLLTILISIVFVLIFEGPFRLLNKLIIFPIYNQDRISWGSSISKNSV